MVMIVRMTRDFLILFSRTSSKCHFPYCFCTTQGGETSELIVLFTLCSKYNKGWRLIIRRTWEGAQKPICTFLWASCNHNDSSCLASKTNVCDVHPLCTRQCDCAREWGAPLVPRAAHPAQCTATCHRHRLRYTPRWTPTPTPNRYFLFHSPPLDRIQVLFNLLMSEFLISVL